MKNLRPTPSNIRHLKGFTLIEAMITLGLAGLVVALGMLIYRSMTSMHMRYETRIEQSWDKAVLEERLELDLQKAYHYREEGEKRFCLLDREEEVIVCYEQRDSVLFRERLAQIDTLLVGPIAAHAGKTLGTRLRKK